MNKIIEYTNLACSRQDRETDSVPLAIKELTKLVNNYIVKGWEPIGGIIVTELFVFQTIIRRS